MTPTRAVNGIWGDRQYDTGNGARVDGGWIYDGRRVSPLVQRQRLDAGTMKPARKKPSRDAREAACLLKIKKGDDWLIPEPLRSSGDARAIVAWAQRHHLREGVGEPSSLCKLR